MSAGDSTDKKTEAQLVDEIPEVVEATVRESEVRLVVEEEPISLHKSEIRRVVDGRVDVQGGFTEPVEQRSDETAVYILDRTQLAA